MRRPRQHFLLLLLLLLVLYLLTAVTFAASRPFVLFITKDDLADNEPEPSAAAEEEPIEWDEPGESGFDLDPGSWISVMDPSFDLHPNWTSEGGDSRELRYAAGLRGMIDAVSAGDLENFEQAVSEIEGVAMDGYPHAQSIMGFLYGFGIMKHQSRSKAFLYHNFAHEKSTQSKMALAYTYYREEMHEKAAELYAEVAELAVSDFFISKIPPSIEPLRLHKGSEENKQALRKYRGEDDEDFQVMEYQAMRGETEAMYKVGLFFYFGLRGVRQDHRKAMHLFLKAAEKGEARSMELLGEIYARGLGVEKNYTKAFEWLNRASQHLHVSAYNGLGYLHVKGYGLENKNFTKAKEYFEIAASNEDPGGYYNLGVLYLKGLGVKKNVVLACLSFIKAANAGHPKAIYQVARMFQKGIGLKKNLAMATLYYKIVAEKGPWSSLLSWALESYVKGDVGKALLFYSRMSELGYEVAQSNAAWILDKYSENSLCLGESGFCTDTERYLRAHSLWWKASEQGNEQAPLLIGDAYYYGRGTESDYERAAEAYMHAKSQSNAQAIFNLGYMHEHGQGLPYDLHLAKRYYDLALESDPAAKLPVTLALTSLWIRKNYVDSFLVDLIDSLPLIFPRVKAWVDNVLMDEGNAAILTLFLCLLTVLYIRERQRQHVVIPQRLDGERNQL